MGALVVDFLTESPLRLHAADYVAQMTDPQSLTAQRAARPAYHPRWLFCSLACTSALLGLCKFVQGTGWRPRKLDCSDIHTETPEACLSD